MSENTNKKHKKPESVHSGHRIRMKNKYLSRGADVFEDHELLELLLFYAVPRKSTNDTAHKLLERFGSLKGVLDASFDELIKVEGIKHHSAVLIMSIRGLFGRYALSERKKGFRFDNVDKIGSYFIEKYIGETKETVFLMLLNNSFELIDCKKIFEGSVNSAALSPRELFDFAYSKNASNAVLAHNHPKGIAVPSEDDVNTTANLAAGFDLLGINMLEHILVADNKFVPVMRSSRKLLRCRSGEPDSFYADFYGFEKNSGESDFEMTL